MRIDFSTLSNTQLEAIAESLLASHRGSRVAPYLLGLIMDGLLQGVIFTQFGSWLSKSFKSERKINCFLAFYTFFIGIAFTFVQAARALWSFAYNYGEYLPIFEGHWAMALILLLWIVHIPVQIFYIERAYLLSGRNKIVLIVLGLMVLAVTGVAIAELVAFPQLILSWTLLEQDLLTASGALTAATDVTITGVIIYCLLRRRTGEMMGDRLITKFIILSAESQLPPSICAIVLAGVDGAGLIWVSPVFVPIMVKLSIVSLFNVLNSRRKFREKYLPQTIVPPKAATPTPESLFYPPSFFSDTRHHRVVVEFFRSTHQGKGLADGSCVDADSVVAHFTPPLSNRSDSVRPLMRLNRSNSFPSSSKPTTLDLGLLRR